MNIENQPSHKFCSSCKCNKRASEFWKDKNKPSGLRIYCKDCGRDRAKKWKNQNKDRVFIYNKRSRDKAYFMYRYGIPNEVVERMRVSQNGKCAICGNDGKLELDHCHTTGVIRELLCTPCNRMLGQARESGDILLAAVDYLSKHWRKQVQ